MATTVTEVSNNKRNMGFQMGLEKMRDADVLKTCGTSLKTLANLVSKDADKSFDLLYVNMPWKSVDMEYAANLPMKALVNGKDHAGLLLWVDSPCVHKASTLLNTWGFKFHSVLHVTSYVNHVVDKTVVTADVVPATTTTTTEEVDGQSNANNTTEEVSTTKTVAPTTRKTVVPHGWMVDGLIPSRSRQLWFAVADKEETPYLKDVSFVRKRVQATSTFEYSKSSETNVTTLSSKKKNLDNWLLFPEYDAYVPPELRSALETIHKPNARVLSLFSDSLNRNWYTWGPNIPGYISCPLRPDGGFPIVNALLKYFSVMKGATVQKYLTLMNLYAVQYAKQLGNMEMPTDELDEDGNPKQFLAPLVVGRMQDFFTDLTRRYQEGGGVKECDLASTCLVKLEGLTKDFGTFSPNVQTQVLLLVGQVIRVVLKKNADTTERRKRAIKRKREMNGEEGDIVEGEPKPRVPRKFGIAAPVDISKELATFMNLAPGEKVARTTVVKYINEYIRTNNLQNPQRKSEINCNEALKKLLNPSPTFGQINYFNLCKLLGPHFLTKTTPAAGKKVPVSLLPSGPPPESSALGDKTPSTQPPIAA